jgi:hypothetical protein
MMGAEEIDVPVLIRLLSRLATLWLLGFMRRRAVPRTPGTVPPWTPPGAGTASPSEAAEALRRRARRVADTAVEVVRIGGHVLAVAAFLGAFAVLTAAGTTASSLGPRWLGIACLVLAFVALIAGLGEFRVVWRLRLAQRRRRRAEELARLGGKPS